MKNKERISRFGEVLDEAIYMSSIPRWKFSELCNISLNTLNVYILGTYHNHIKKACFPTAPILKKIMENIPRSYRAKLWDAIP